MTDKTLGFLADTWWYAMTARLSDENFRKLVDLRVNQGFSAAQFVVGIPPESTPEDANAASVYGPAWTRDGAFNRDYLQHARQRMIALNQAGLTGIVYGAWGPQINWLGTERMIDWWKEVINISADLDVIYCLAGESNLRVGPEDLKLLQNRRGLSRLIENINGRSKLARRVVNRVYRFPALTQARRRAWSRVLEEVAPLTGKPILIHPNPNDTGFECVDNPYLLSANTAQTGHTYEARQRLHQLPLAHCAALDPAGRGFINLEPWYEGIRDRFYASDQLYAYWVSMLAGAVSYCYGAHGIWNVGDGKFLAHWGSQIFAQALELDTPRLIGLSHQLLRRYLPLKAAVEVQEETGSLISLQRKMEQATITYIPEISHTSSVPEGKVWLPAEGRFTAQLPAAGQVVIISGAQARS